VIINFLATGVLGLISWITTFLPAGSPWAPPTGTLATWLGYLYGVDAYLPVTEVFICAAIGIAIMNAKLPFAIGNWVWRRIRG
jgi:hypothetical protein